MNTRTVILGPDRQVEVAFDDNGAGQTFLLLHGGAGPISVAGLAQRLAGEGRSRAIVPTHPGFGGTTRPDWLSSPGGLAELYEALIEQLDLKDVIVVGSSLGGWIAAEMALRAGARTRGFILIDAVGIQVEGRPVVDIFPLSMDELVKLSYHNPAAFRPDLSALTDAQKSIMAGNRQALAVYGSAPAMNDPTLRGRLHAVTAPTLVLWGESDQVVTPDYGRAFAEAIPSARFQLLEAAGHLPQIETPDAVLGAIQGFVDGPG